MTSDTGLHRARTELEAARLLAEHGFAAQAVSRAYFAAFYAAEAALQRIGQVRSKHSGVVAAFARLIVGQQHVPDDAGRLLRSLFERRSHADNDVGDTPPDEAARALIDAATVVDAVAEWLEHESDQA